jgi:hypothetical protein
LAHFSASCPASTQARADRVGSPRPATATPAACSSKQPGTSGERCARPSPSPAAGPGNRPSSVPRQKQSPGGCTSLKSWPRSSSPAGPRRGRGERAGDDSEERPAALLRATDWAILDPRQRHHSRSHTRSCGPTRAHQSDRRVDKADALFPPTKTARTSEPLFTCHLTDTYSISVVTARATPPVRRPSSE